VVGSTANADVLQALAVADRQWRDFGLEPDCQPKIIWLFDNAGFSGAADDDTCWFGIGVTMVRHLEAAKRTTDVALKRQAYGEVCHLIVHEKGHLLGFADFDGSRGNGVMTWDRLYSSTLPRCDAWAAQKAPKPKCFTRRCKAERFLERYCARSARNLATKSCRARQKSDTAA